MFGLGWPELIIILLIILLIFGGSRLRGVAKGLGESIREFRKASSGEYQRTMGFSTSAGRAESRKQRINLSR